jgi:hypothetical protein
MTPGTGEQPIQGMPQGVTLGPAIQGLPPGVTLGQPVGAQAQQQAAPTPQSQQPPQPALEQ